MQNLTYKQQIEQGLLTHDWQISLVGANTDWWDDEHWLMKCRYKPDINLYICFMVDPSFEGERKSGQAVYEIIAVTQFPSAWIDDSHMIATLNMQKSVFAEKLSKFIDEISKL